MSNSWAEENSELKHIDNEQSHKADYGKAKLSLVPRRIIWDIAAVREYGNEKYPDGGPDNWKTVEPERYRDALYRHLMLYLDDPYGEDKESGLPHLWHIACNVAFLCELEDNSIKKLHFNNINFNSVIDEELVEAINKTMKRGIL